MPPFYRPVSLGKNIISQYRFNFVVNPRGCGVFKDKFFVGDTVNRIWVFDKNFTIDNVITLPAAGNNSVSNFSANGDYLFCTTDGPTRAIWRSSDGVVFNNIFTSPTIIVSGECNSKGEFLFAKNASDGNNIIYSNDNGNTVNVGRTNIFAAITSYPNSVKYLNGVWLLPIQSAPSGSYLKATSPAGLITSAKFSVSAPFNQYITIWGYDKGLLWAASDDSQLFYSDNMGSSWSQSKSYCAPGGPELRDCRNFNSTLYACDTLGNVIKINGPDNVSPIAIANQDNINYLSVFGEQIVGIGIERAFILKSVI